MLLCGIFSIFSILFRHLLPYLLFCQPKYLLSWKFDVSWLRIIMHVWTAKNLDAILYEPCSYTALLLSQNGLRSNLTASTFWKFSWRSMPLDPPIYSFIITHIVYTLETHVIPLLKCLSMGLIYVHESSLGQKGSLLPYLPLKVRLTSCSVCSLPSCFN